jgi:ATP-dependent Clp protease, protease subunit
MTEIAYKGKLVADLGVSELKEAHRDYLNNNGHVLFSGGRLKGKAYEIARSLLDAENRLGIVLNSNVTPLKRPQAKARGQYRMLLNKGNDRGEIWLYGTIGTDWFGDGVSAKQFADDLKKLGKVQVIDLRINSDGGVVTDARAMYNLLVEHPATVISHIDGIAASAASFLAMAGNEIEIAEGGFIMVHNARGITIGEAVDHERMATVLRQVNQTIVDTYVARTKQEEKKVKKWMDDETWFTGKEAVTNGFADRMTENLQVAASLTHPERFKRLPSALLPKRAAALAKIAALRS